MKFRMYDGEKFYLETWFIALMFALWPLVLPAFGGVVFLIMQLIENKKLTDKYGEYDNIENKINELNNQYNQQMKDLAAQKETMEKEQQDELAKTMDDIEHQKKKHQSELDSLKEECKVAKDELSTLEGNLLKSHYNFSDYDCITSEECKNKLSMIKLKESELLKDNSGIIITSSDAKKELNNNIKQLIRCFNSECDNVILNISVKNIDNSRNKITKSFESLNKIFVTDGIALSEKVLEYKLEELNLVYTFELKKQQEKEQQKAIKEQMLEEEKVLREIERQKKQIEKDQTQFNNEVNKLMQYMQKTENDVEKQLYADKIKELEEKLKALEAEKETVIQREQNAKAGFVYVISNIGSFGDDVYKIGMTRRLEPMDRIKELSSASVPFEFDVHAMIFSDDAPALEASLHQHFKKNSVNKINFRKEFFRVSLDEVEKYVKENFNNTVEFTKTALATEYRQSLELAE